MDNGFGFIGLTNGMSFSEIDSYSFVNWKFESNSTGSPISIRNGLFGYGIGLNVGGGQAYYNAYEGLCDGRGYSKVTFRPVVWN